MKILVLGGTGFIGNHIVRELEKSHDVFCASRSNGLDLEKDDISCLGNFEFDVVIHLAAHVGSVKYVFENGADVIRKNLLINLNAFNSALNVKASKIICINAACIYPAAADIQDEKVLWNGEPHPSSSSFSSTKRAMIHMGKAFFDQHGLKSVNVILPGVYGPGDDTDPMKVHAMNALIIKAVRNILFEEKILVWGTGRPIREWLYVKDIASLINEILVREDLPDYFNIGQEKGHSIADTVKILQKKLSIPNSEIEYLTQMQDGDPRKILGGELFKKLFKNFNFTSLDYGIDKTIEYYKSKLMSNIIK